MLHAAPWWSSDKSRPVTLWYTFIAAHTTPHHPNTAQDVSGLITHSAKSHMQRTASSCGSTQVLADLMHPMHSDAC